MSEWFRLVYDLLKDFSASVLTLLGLAAIGIMPYFGFRSFDSWKREHLEESGPGRPSSGEMIERVPRSV